MPQPRPRHVPDLAGDIGELRHVGEHHQILRHRRGERAADRRRAGAPGVRLGAPFRPRRRDGVGGPALRGAEIALKQGAGHTGGVALDRPDGGAGVAERFGIDVDPPQRRVAAQLVAPQIVSRQLGADGDHQIGLGEHVGAAGARKKAAIVERGAAPHDPAARPRGEARRTAPARHLAPGLRPRGRAAAEDQQRPRGAAQRRGERVGVRCGGRRGPGCGRGRACRLGRGLEHADRHLDVLGPRAARLEFGHGAVDQPVGRLGAAGLEAPVAHAFGGAALVAHLVQLAALGGGVVEAGRDHQHRHRIGVGLPHRRHGVAQPRPGDDVDDSGPARGAGVAVGHEARPLLVAGENMGNAGLAETAVEFLVVDSGNAEHPRDAPLAEHPADLLAKRSCGHHALQKLFMKMA